MASSRSLTEKVYELEKTVAVAAESQKAIDQQFEHAQKQLREAFDALASRALRQNSEQFLQLARKSFEGEQKDAAAQLENRKQAIQAMVSPLRESLDKYNRFLQEAEKGRKEEYGSLAAQIERLGKETTSLTDVLRNPGVRGQWGQIQLRRVAELAGMIPYCDFQEQPSVQTEQGRRQPDMIVRLPNERTIVVDAKTPFDAFFESLNADQESHRQQCLQRHAETIDGHVRQLATKEYQAAYDRSPEFVVLFIPVESILYAAVRIRPQLLETAMGRGVLIASPTTLMALLKAVATGWKEQQLAQNAKRISELGQELHERIANATGHIEKLGKNLEQAVIAYNQFVGSYETRVMSSARRFGELGASSSKRLPDEIKPVEAVPRAIKPLVSEDNKPAR